ncbi:MAG: Gfo/Idh/MocA family oxidoreductase [Spirochaetes bacterium]|nr:Gfo/Idh/MocA family oxidoreductase [Spirochaetota bacterium]
MTVDLKIGLIGAGYAAHRRASAIRELDSKRLVIKGVYDKNTEHSSEFSKEFNINSYTSIEEMCIDTGINTVSVAVPNKYHYEIVKYALENGKNVLCEYPLVLDKYKKGEELVRLAGKKGLFLHVGQTMNYDADYKLIESYRKDLGRLVVGYKYMSFGTLGSWFELDGFKGNYRGLGKWYVDDNKDGGWIVSAHYHGIQLFRNVFGEVSSVCAFDTSDKDIAAASVILSHENKATSAIQWSMPIYGKAFDTTLVSGSNGSIEVDCERFLVHTAEIKKEGRLTPVNTFIEDLRSLLNELDGKKDINKENWDMLRNLKVAVCAGESAVRGKEIKISW